MVVWTRDTNPIEWLEINYQRRAIPALIQRWWLFAPLTLMLMIIGILLTLREVNTATRDLALYGIWLVQIVTVIRALVAGSNTISREHTAQTWDTLIMTGVSARQILMGKWLAVMHRVAPWMLGLGMMRLIMLPVLMLAFVNRYAWFSASAGYAASSGVFTGSDPRSIAWVAWAALAAVGLTVLLTVLEVLCCTAIGLATSAVTRRGWLATILAFCIRFMPVVLFAAFTRYQVGGGPAWRVLRFTPLALADSGSAALYQLVLPLTRWTTTAHVDALPGAVLAVSLLTILLAGALLTAWAAIRAAGALPRVKLANTEIAV